MKTTAPRALALIMVAFALLAIAACGGDEPERSDATRGQPYAGLKERRVRALSDERVADLLAGRGAGYALAAELNHYPGPMHVLELADELRLTDRQRRVARALEVENHRRAKALGRRLVQLEAQLDRAFRSGAISRNAVRRLTADIAALDGRLRALHLDAHLAMREVLEPAQVARYAELRGYAAAGHQTATNGHHGS